MAKELEGQLEFDFMEGLKSKEGRMIDNLCYGLMIMSTALTVCGAYITVKVLSDFPPIKNTIEYIF